VLTLQSFIRIFYNLRFDRWQVVNKEYVCMYVNG